MSAETPPMAREHSIDRAVDELLERFGAIGLDELDRVASLRTRKDRKYVVTAAELRSLLESLLESLPESASDGRNGVRVLEIDGRRWFRYESIYFDTDDLDSYRLAARRRPQRFKARIRRYVDADIVTAEVKTKTRRGRTHKYRRTIDDPTVSAVEMRELAEEIAESAPFADGLEPVLTSRYRRATLVMPASGVRVTIDAAYRCIDTVGASTGLAEHFIVETKTGGEPSLVDRALWGSGHRPEKISKYATGLAALRPGLPANRWHPVLRTHFAHSPRRLAAETPDRAQAEAA